MSAMINTNQPWATVVAALGASLLTVLGSFGLLQWQRWRDSKANAMKDRAAVYAELHARAGSFAHRAGVLGLAKQFRSGVTEGLYILLGYRTPIEIFRLYEWVDADYRPLSDAWSKIHLIGSQKVIIAADRLVDACGELMEVAVATNSQRNYLARLLSGEVQSPQQAEAHQEAMRKLFKEREAFAAIVREETGQAPAEMPIERSGRQ